VTVKRKDGRYSVECDSCGELVAHEAASMAHALQIFSRKKGRTSEDSDGFAVHRCIGCARN
jgi:transcription elongation factor Elf1